MFNFAIVLLGLMFIGTSSPACRADVFQEANEAEAQYRLNLFKDTRGSKTQGALTRCNDALAVLKKEHDTLTLEFNRLQACMKKFEFPVTVTNDDGSEKEVCMSGELIKTMDTFIAEEEKSKKDNSKDVPAKSNAPQ